MTLQDLKNRFVSALFSGYGHYRVTFKIRGVNRSVITTDLEAVDRINNEHLLPHQKSEGNFGLTEKQAYQQLWDEVNSR